MSADEKDIKIWIARVQQAPEATKVFQVLNEFRKLDWTDEERVRMSKIYMRVLERVGAPAREEQEEIIEKDDGPVWYEKM